MSQLVSSSVSVVVVSVTRATYVLERNECATLDNPGMATSTYVRTEK